MKRAVFLDRDGVINETVFREGRPAAPSHSSAFQIMEGVPEALRDLKSGGFILVVTTNQPDLSKGILPPEELEKMHSDLRTAAPVDEILVCPHLDLDGCTCRKPKPGMLLEAARKWNIDLSRSFMIGDRWRDIDAGKAAGCQTILVGSGYGEREIHPDWKVASLAEGARIVLESAGDNAEKT